MRFLELGVGTGRVALPVASRGYSYTGVDISTEMMARLRAKADLPNLTLREADVTDLPFEDGGFDVVLAFHVLHLVPEWRQALAEARRVTAAGGYFLFGGNEGADDDPYARIRQRWAELARELGAGPSPRHVSLPDLAAELTAQDCRLAVYRVAAWTREFRPIDLIERLHARTFSASWDMPDEAMDAIHERLLAWTHETFGDLEASLETKQEFRVTAARWPA
jgi:SAM-dependent methyltransferase